MSTGIIAVYLQLLILLGGTFTMTFLGDCISILYSKLIKNLPIRPTTRQTTICHFRGDELRHKSLKECASLIRENRRICIDDLATTLSVSHAHVLCQSSSPLKCQRVVWCQ